MPGGSNFRALGIQLMPPDNDSTATFTITNINLRWGIGAIFRQQGCNEASGAGVGCTLDQLLLGAHPRAHCCRLSRPSTPQFCLAEILAATQHLTDA